MHAVSCSTRDVALVKQMLSVALAISAVLAACVREPDVIEPGEALPPYDVVDTEPAPKPWLDVPVAQGEEDCELRHVERMLNANCGECHSMPSFFPCSDCPNGTLGEPLRISNLIELGKITPGASDASRVMIRLYSGEMPPPSSGLPPMSETDVAWLASFIDTLDPGVTPACSAESAP
jgi:hypothetical protein